MTAAAALQTRSILSADGVAMDCDFGGQGGPLLLFVHGWTCRRSYWQPQLGHFAAGWRVAAPDLPGHGTSTGEGRTTWNLAAFAGDVAACARQLGASRVVLVGHSMGGAVALEAARLLPATVMAVVLADTFVIDYGGLDAQTVGQIAAPFESDFPAAMTNLVEMTSTAQTPPSLRQRLVAEMSAADPAWALPVWRDLLAWNPAAAFAKLDLPIHAINGVLIPDSARLRCAPFVRERLLPGAGHFLQLEDPTGFNRALEEILADLS